MNKVHIKINKDLFHASFIHAKVATKLQQLDNAAGVIRKVLSIFKISGSK